MMNKYKEKLKKIIEKIRLLPYPFNFGKKKLSLIVFFLFTFISSLDEFWFKIHFTKSISQNPLRFLDNFFSWIKGIPFTIKYHGKPHISVSFQSIMKILRFWRILFPTLCCGIFLVDSSFREHGKSFISSQNSPKILNRWIPESTERETSSHTIT